MASLSLRHVNKVYPNGKKAVSDFSMEIGDREFIVFVGPSGCGKSTTLRMIAGLEEITTGEIYIDGVLVNDMEPKDRDIAMVFQNYALYPHVSVYENMAFGLKIRKLPSEEIHRRVLEAAEILGITEYLSKKPREMSGGQRQRVALGRAIVREPKVFLLDEPLSNLDAKLRTEMRAQISKLHARLGTTFIYVTHDQTEAMTMGSRIVVMKDGVVQQIDTPRALYRAPQSKFVASFIGTPQMNFYGATLCREGEWVHLSLTDAGISWRLPRAEFSKMRPAYLNGDRSVMLGIRAEQISAEVSDTALRSTVSYVEELGDEALVYGELSEPNESVADTRTSVVFKVDAARGAEIRSGDVIPISFDLSRAHFFDAESGESIRKAIPDRNVIVGEMDETSVTVAGCRIPLPPVLQGRMTGTVTLDVPIRAVRRADGSKAVCRIVSAERIGATDLTGLMLGEDVLFAEGALGAVGESVGIGLDFRQITMTDVRGRTVSALRERSCLYGRILRESSVRSDAERGAGRGRKAVRFLFEMEGARYEIPDALMERLLKTAGVGVLKRALRYEIPPEAIRIGEGSGEGHVLRMLDYGDGALYCLLSVGGRELVARTDTLQSGTVRFSVDLSAVTFVDDRLDVILA